MRVAIWHQQLLGEDTFLGEVHLSVGALSTSRSHEAWYTLSSHWEEQEEASTSVIGSLRLLVSYHEDLIHPMSGYEPLKQMLLDGLVEEVSDYRSCLPPSSPLIHPSSPDSWHFLCRNSTTAVSIFCTKSARTARRWAPALSRSSSSWERWVV